MRHRILLITIAIVTVVVQASAQALSSRYDSSYPVVVVCEQGHPPYAFLDSDGQPAGCLVDVMTAVADELGVPCEFVMNNRLAVQEIFEHNNATLILTAGSRYSASPYTLSKSVIGYMPVGADSVAEIRFAGKDRQLIEQMDGKYMRLRQEGDIAALQARWLHPERGPEGGGAIAGCFPCVVALIAAVLFLMALLLMRCNRKAALRTVRLSAMASEAQRMRKYYAKEDIEAAPDLVYAHEGILSNPFTAFAFYDKNGRLIAQNEAMRQLGRTIAPSQRLPLFSANGEIANYFVAVPADSAT